jgi:hypothetical protein
LYCYPHLGAKGFEILSSNILLPFKFLSGFEFGEALLLVLDCCKLPVPHLMLKGEGFGFKFGKSFFRGVKGFFCAILYRIFNLNLVFLANIHRGSRDPRFPRTSYNIIYIRGIKPKGKETEGERTIVRKKLD